jgi:hypothetical protein
MRIDISYGRSELFQSHGRVFIVSHENETWAVLFQCGMVVQERRGHACNRHTNFVPDRMRFGSWIPSSRIVDERVIIVCSSSSTVFTHVGRKVANEERVAYEFAIRI